MSKRSYTKLQAKEKEIVEMKEAGATNGEIALHFGIKERQIINLINRRNRRIKEVESGEVPKQKGRPRKNSESVEAELERLRMENKLLQDFLQSIERK